MTTKRLYSYTTKKEDVGKKVYDNIITDFLSLKDQYVIKLAKFITNQATKEDVATAITEADITEKLNDYYKNISKNTVFFVGEIGKDGNKRAFAGFPWVVFIDKGSKTISVLCKNFVDGIEQNSFSIIHIVYIDGVYYHYQYYSTKHIYIFLRMVCNNNKMTVSDIKILFFFLNKFYLLY